MNPLFTPYTLNNGVEIKNRLVVAPMTHLGSNDDGTLGKQERAFIAHRAEDFGIFITAATLTHKSGKAFYGQPEATETAQLASLKETADIIKAQGAKAILQLHHGGKLAIAELIRGYDKISADDDAETNTRMATDAEVRELIGSFATATELAIQAEFDGVEIHGANNYLIQQFYSGHSNRRSDEWGGSREKRMRFPLAIIEAVNAVKAKHGKDEFIVGYRFSPEEPEELGLTMEDTFALLDVLKEQPLQYLHVSLWGFYNKVRRGADTNAHRIQLIHDRIGGKLPLIGVGMLYTADEITQAFDTGWAEFIALGKTVMVNPDIATKLKNGDTDSISREIDPDRTDRYGFPDKLWEFTLAGGNWLPPVKGRTQKTLMFDKENTMQINHKPTVLVLGATGTVGSQAVKELEQSQAVNIRIPSRNMAVVKKLQSEGKNAVYLDLDKPQTFALALAGVERIFLLTGYTVAMLAQSKTLVDAAKKAGVKHIVHVGIFAEWDCTNPHFTWHQLIEKYIEASGIAWTHLHPNMFMEAVTGLYMPKKMTYTTYFDDRRIGFVASSDIAAVAAKILVDGPEKHAGQHYWLSVESYNGKEIVEILNEITGLDIKLEHKSLEDFRAMVEVPDFPIESQYARANIEFVAQVRDNRLGYMAAIRNDIPYVLGRPAKTLREHLTEHKDAIIRSATQDM